MTDRDWQCYPGCCNDVIRCATSPDRMGHAYASGYNAGVQAEVDGQVAEVLRAWNADLARLNRAEATIELVFGVLNNPEYGDGHARPNARRKLRHYLNTTSPRSSTRNDQQEQSADVSYPQRADERAALSEIPGGESGVRGEGKAPYRIDYVPSGEPCDDPGCTSPGDFECQGGIWCERHADRVSQWGRA